LKEYNGSRASAILAFRQRRDLEVRRYI